MSTPSVASSAPRAEPLDGASEGGNGLPAGPLQMGTVPAPVRTRPADAPLHVAFVGSEALLGSLAPSADAPGVVFTRLTHDEHGRSALSPPVDVTVIFDPPRSSAAELASFGVERLHIAVRRRGAWKRD